VSDNHLARPPRRVLRHGGVKSRCELTLDPEETDMEKFSGIESAFEQCGGGRERRDGSVVYEQRHANELAGILGALEPIVRSWSVW